MIGRTPNLPGRDANFAVAYPSKFPSIRRKLHCYEC